MSVSKDAPLNVLCEECGEADAYTLVCVDKVNMAVCRPCHVWLDHHSVPQPAPSDPDGPMCCPDCGDEPFNDDDYAKHRWMWHGGPEPTAPHTDPTEAMAVGVTNTMGEPTPCRDAGWPAVQHEPAAILRLSATFLNIPDILELRHGTGRGSPERHRIPNQGEAP